MKFVVFITLLLISCTSHNVEDSQKNQLTEELNCNSFHEIALRLEFDNIDLSVDLNPLLDENSFMTFIKSSNEIECKLESTKLILLKLYLYHLERSNQGYDLLVMKKGTTKYLIEFYQKHNSLSSEMEFINSSYPFHIEKESKVHSKNIKEVLVSIQKEIDRILAR